MARGVGLGDAQITANWTADSWLEDIDAGCQYSTVEAAPVADLIVQPLSVSIDSFKAVGKNPPNTDFRAKIRIIVNNPNNVPITLTLYPIQGTTGEAQFADINTTTTTITQTTDVEIRGITESSTENNMRLEATYNGHSLDMKDFTVLSVTLSLRYNNSDTVSSDNSARNAQQAAVGTLRLGGPFLSSGTTSPILWRHVIEIVGTILPNNYSDPIILQRELESTRSYNRSNTVTDSKGRCSPNDPPCSDTSLPDFRDDNPLSGDSQGKVYDLDSPGINLTGASQGAIQRRRTNFRQWATVSQKQAGVIMNVRVSPDIQWFHRISIEVNQMQETQINNDVPNDNQIGQGTTSLSWDLSNT